MGWPWLKKQRNERQPSLMAGQDDYVFRRSRTLTGTTSNNIAVSAEGRGVLKTPRLKLHELHQNRVQIIKLFSGATLLIGIVVYIAAVYVAKPQIIFAQIGLNQPSIAAYDNSIQEYFDNRPLERLGFALNNRTLEESLKKQHTELKAVSLERAWYGGDVHFTLYFREPLLTWSTAGQKYYVDSQGYAFNYNHFAEPGVTVIDQSGISPDVGGGAVASGRFVSFLGRMVGALNSYGKGRVEAVTLPASTREIDLKLQVRASLIKTHIDRDPLEQAEDIANAIKYFDSRAQVPEYIDVRVAGKAFYR